MTKLLATTALGAVMVFGAMGTATAVPLSGTFAVSLYQFNNPNPGDGGNASQQALPSATAFDNSPDTFSYTGALNFSEGSNGTNTVSAFIASGGGSTVGTVPNTTLSSGGFNQTSLFKFTFTTTTVLSGTIAHDDGVSLFVSGKTGNANDLLPLADSGPTSLEFTSFTNLAAGTYDLYYTEANGLPAQLSFNINVPEPTSLMILGAGLIGLGVVSRRGRGSLST